MKGLEILIDLNEAHRFNEDLVSEPVYLATAAPYRSHFTERDSCCVGISDLDERSPIFDWAATLSSSL